MKCVHTDLQQGSVNRVQNRRKRSDVKYSVLAWTRFKSTPEFCRDFKWKPVIRPVKQSVLILFSFELGSHTHYWLFTCCSWFTVWNCHRHAFRSSLLWGNSTVLTIRESHWSVVFDKWPAKWMCCNTKSYLPSFLWFSYSYSLAHLLYFPLSEWLWLSTTKWLMKIWDSHETSFFCCSLVSSSHHLSWTIEVMLVLH